METKQENRRSDVIRCEFCGEDYSVTYKHCPFCDDRAFYGREQSRGKGGKRVATNKRGGGYGGGMQPVQIIGLALSFILIIAAIYIVFTVLSPLFTRDDPVGSESSAQISTSQSGGEVSQPEVSVSLPGVSTSGDISAPVIPDVSSDPTILAPIVSATGITLNIKDVTLKANETPQIKAALTPADCTDTITWTSSDESALTVAQDGTVTNINKGSSQANVTVTAQVGDVKATCIVRCKGGSTGTAPTAPTTPTTPANPTPAPSVAPGTKGTVTGTSTGLFVRTGPSKTAQAKESLLNGTQVTILEQTGDGWYKINYSGNGGKTETGYVSKDYVKVN